MSKKILIAAASLFIGLQSFQVSASTITAAQAAVEKQDYDTALKALAPLIKEGDVNATNLMGQMYENGWGVEKDIDQAKKFYDQGARRGHLASVNSLRKLKNIDYKVELDALLPKVAAGDAEAQNRAGEMYEFGYGTDRNPQEAFRLYKLAADQGSVNAQHNLGRSYNFGTGTEQNFVEAERWYRIASEKGHTESMFFLGTLYSNGYGEDKSHAGDIIAYAWMHNAAALGNPTASAIESRLLMKLQESQMDEAKALAASYESEYVKPFKK